VQIVDNFYENNFHKTKKVKNKII